MLSLEQLPTASRSKLERKYPVHTNYGVAHGGAYNSAWVGVRYGLDWTGASRFSTRLDYKYGVSRVD